MPTYPYCCIRCGEHSEIIKSIRDAQREEICQTCSVVLSRTYTAPIIIGARVENAEYNHGLGVVTKSAKHRNEVAKQMGLTEVGNETPATLAKDASYRQKQRDKEWDSL